MILNLLSIGFEPGVVNILNGGGDVGNMLALHPLIRKVSLTGSIPSGRSVVKASASSNLKSVGLELGGKSPTIVFADADLETALKSIEASAVYNLAQVCLEMFNRRKRFAEARSSPSLTSITPFPLRSLPLSHDLFRPLERFVWRQPGSWFKKR